MQPRIGVLPLQNTEKQIIWMNPLYLWGVEQAGGLAAVLSLTENRSLWEEYCNAFDGFVFTGGQDVDPARYGQEKLPACGYQAPLRDSQELYMMRRLRDLNKPVLGICRGVQVMNTAFGGTLYQNLPSQHPSPVIHLQSMPYELPHHQVSILPGSRLSGMVGAEHLSVNSMHHQAVRDPAPGFQAVAWAEDGLIEAIELPGARFFLGVQWHPEHLWRNYRHARRLWEALVNACK